MTSTPQARGRAGDGTGNDLRPSSRVSSIAGRSGMLADRSPGVRGQRQCTPVGRCCSGVQSRRLSLRRAFADSGVAGLPQIDLWRSD